MTTKYPCYIEFSDNGNFARIVHKSGMILGEFLVYDVMFAARAAMAHDRLGLRKNLFRPSSHFTGVIESITPKEMLEEVTEQLEITKTFKENKLNAESQVQTNNSR
jgi:hypothetical protein